MENDPSEKNNRIPHTKISNVEILPPKEEQDEDYSKQTYNRWRNDRYGNSNIIWSYSSFNNPGCLAGAITFGIFLIIVAQYGLLAGIGFFVFHVIGSVLTALQASRALVNGRYFSIWTARILNWVICVLLIIWLSGGN